MNKTKSGQSTDELYVPTGCIFKVSQFRNLWWSRQAVEQIPRWNWVHRSKNYLGSKKNSLAETKIKLLAKCTNAIKNSALIESQGIRHSSFATYVEEKFSSLNKCQITIAERGSMMFCLSLKCLLEMNLLTEILNLSRMSHLSRDSTVILKIF